MIENHASGGFKFLIFQTGLSARMSSVVRPGRKEEREESVNQRAGHVTVAHRGRTLVWGGYMENQVGQ